jgi:RHS repeat-associated protein
VTNNYQVAALGPSISSQTHDANGNMTSDGTNLYTWDAENRLIKITYLGSGNFSEILYDANGLQGQITETRLGAVVGTKQLLRRGGKLFEECDATGSVVKKFFGFGQTVSGSSYLYAKDYLGSTRELVDSSGNVVTSYGYTLFGQPIADQGAVDSDFQYCGYYYHSASRLNLMTKRLYNPLLARWLNRDPMREFGGTNLFVYVNNAPTRLVDPDGAMAVHPRAGGDPGHNTPPVESPDPKPGDPGYDPDEHDPQSEKFDDSEDPHWERGRFGHKKCIDWCKKRQEGDDPCENKPRVRNRRWLRDCFDWCGKLLD